ncbi:hypothetical protein ACLOJK_029177 [Asimina triloba]
MIKSRRNENVMRPGRLQAGCPPRRTTKATGSCHFLSSVQWEYVGVAGSLSTCTYNLPARPPRRTNAVRLAEVSHGGQIGKWIGEREFLNCSYNCNRAHKIKKALYSPTFQY